MSSERIQHRIERLLGQAKEATDRHDWEQANQIAEDVLAIDPDNGDAKAYIDSHQQRRIELLLDQVEEAADRRDWYQVRLFAGDILAIDPSNVDAQTYIVAAERIIKEHGLPEEFFDEAQKGNYEVVIESHSGADSGAIWVRNRKLATLPVKEDLILRYLYRNRGRVIRLEQIRTERGMSYFSQSPIQAKAIIQECIGSLRWKIEKDASNPKIIRNVPLSEDSYIIALVVEQTATVLDTGDIVLPELPEETSQEVDQVTTVEPSEEERTTGGQTTPDKEPPLRQTSPEAAEDKPTRPIGQGAARGQPEITNRVRGFSYGTNSETSLIDYRWGLDINRHWPIYLYLDRNIRYRCSDIYQPGFVYRRSHSGKYAL